MVSGDRDTRPHATTDLSRRKLLATTGAAALASAAGCLGGSGGDGGAQKPTDIESWPPSNLEDTLNSWNWYDDWATWALSEFKNEHEGLSTTNSGYSSPSQWFAKLQAGNTEIDNISATTNWVERSIENDFLHELPVDKMPAWENVLDRAKEFSSYRKDGKVFGIPESLVLYPLTYSTEEFGEAGPDSWGVLWDEQYKNQITMWDNPTVSCQIAALYTGQDPIQPSDFDEIKEVLINQKPLVKTYWSDYQQGMSLFVNDEVVAGPLTMGRTYMARQEGAKAHYKAPKEGAMFTSDLFVVPKGAPHPLISTVFTNWATQPEPAAELFKKMGYKPAVDITDHISNEAAEFISWPDSWDLHFQETLSEDVRSKYDQIWTEVKTA